MRTNLRSPTDGSKLPDMVGAVIYVRVSTKEQTENLSLPTQLKACEEYCRAPGLRHPRAIPRGRREREDRRPHRAAEAAAVLPHEQGPRPVRRRLQPDALRAGQVRPFRAARASASRSGISLRSATEPIDDTSTGKLMEGVLAAFAQFDNDCRSDRTRAGMKAALELGRWTFLAPLGYLNAHRSIGRSLIPDPERAPLVRRAFQDFATGRFTKHEVRKNVNALGLTTRRGKPVPSQTFDAMLRNRVYIAADRRP